MTRFLSILSKFFHQRHLRFDILSSFFFLQAITAATIMFYTYINNSQSMVDFSDRMIQDMSDSKVDHILFRFDSIQRAVEIGSFILSDTSLLTSENRIFLEYAMATVKQNPYIESLFVGTQTGTFIQVKALSANSTYRSSPDKLLPSKAQYALRYLERKGQTGSETWSYYDQDIKLVEKEHLPEFQVTYDHRVREWYTRALQTRSQIWSDIYIFSTTQEAGIANSIPINSADGKPFGVIGADLPLKSITDTLKNMHFKNGCCFILTQKGEVVATSTENKNSKIIDAEAHLPNVSELDNKLPALAYQNYIQHQKKRFIFEDEGKQYIATIRNFDKELFKNWIFVVIIPMDELIGTVKETQNKIMLISFLILAISIIWISLLARRISNPIVALAAQANCITRFDLSPQKEVNSGIREIQVLQSSISAMRRSITSFGKFVPQSLVKKFIDKGMDARIGGKHKRLTIMFSDIQGFTNISETYPPEKLMIHLSEYLEELTRIVINQNGTIDKYIGDAIMAFWGAPQADRDHALNGCKAALLCQKRLNDLNRKWTFEKKPVLITRIGLHTGEVIVGNLGSSERMNYTILGDSVNLAARLEGVNKLYETYIIISEDVFHQIRDQAVARPLDFVAVKGKNKGIKIYELIALKGSDPLLLPTEQQIDFCNNFNRAFTLYLEQRWEEALSAFEKIISIYGNDYTTAQYIERCHHLKQNPPGPDWEGIMHLHSK